MRDHSEHDCQIFSWLSQTWCFVALQWLKKSNDTENAAETFQVFMTSGFICTFSTSIEIVSLVSQHVSWSDCPENLFGFAMPINYNPGRLNHPKNAGHVSFLRQDGLLQDFKILINFIILKYIVFMGQKVIHNKMNIEYHQRSLLA